MPRPARNQRDRRAHHVRDYIADVCRSERHEQLMQLIADGVDDDDQHRRFHVRRSDLRTQTTCHRTKDHEAEAEVLDGVLELVRNSAGCGRTGLRREIEDPSHVDDDRCP